MLRAVLLIVAMCIIPLGCAEGVSSRGVENNNPGNIVKTSIPWQGKVECEDKRFECFSSPYFGVRAMVKNLISYKEKRGLDTIEKIINRWSPPHENDTTDYINYIVYRVGSITDDFYSKLPHLVFHMLHYENGHNPHSITFIEGVVNDTLRDNNPVRLSDFGWCNEVVREENGQREAEASTDDGSFNITTRGEEGDPGSPEQSLYMDKEVYRSDGSSIRFRITQASPVYGTRSGVWMDGVQSRVLVLYRW